MDHKKSSDFFTKRYCSLKCFFMAVALLGIFILSISGITYAQYQMKAPQSHSKATEAYIKVTHPDQDEVWEKGKIHKIRWESKGIRGNVKILLVGQNIKPIEIARNTINSGLYNYIVPRNLHDGTYKIHVMKVDESIKGESSATITIGGQKLGSLKATPQPEQMKPAPVGKLGTQTGTAPTGGAVGTKAPQGTSAPSAATAPSAGATPSTGATPPAGTTASTGVATSTAGTPSKGVTPSTGITGKTPTSAEKIVKQQFTLVKVAEAELKNLPLQKSTASSTDLKIGGKSTSGGKIEVYSPSDGDIWEVDKEYGIRWQSTGITGDVKIVLESTLSVGGKRSSLPITERTPDTGSYRFRVPQNWGQQRLTQVRIRVSTLNGTVSGTSPGTIKVCTKYNIDLECKVMNMWLFISNNSWEKSYLLFNVWMRNKGTQSPVNIQNVLVRLIKEPEKLVVYKEEWGFSGIDHHDWYKLPEPRKIILENLGLFAGKWCRLEVELDPQNFLYEDELFRADNKVVEMIKLY